MAFGAADLDKRRTKQPMKAQEIQKAHTSARMEPLGFITDALIIIGCISSL